MADVITRLKLESGEYDSKIKRATQGLLQMENECRKVGGTLEIVEKETLAFVQGLGKMQTVSQTTRGKIGELTSSFTELSMQYKRLTDEEKSSPFGKALSQSLDELKTRITSTKNDLAEISSQINGVGNIQMSGGMGDALSGLTGKFTMGNLYAEAAMKGVEALESLGQKVVDVANRGMQLSIQAEGIEQAFNRLNRPDILDNVREATHGTVSDMELMKAAVKFDDFNLNLDEMGTLLAFAQKKAKDTGQSVDYMVDSITTGLGRQSLMILDNLGLSAAEIKEKMKETGDMTTAVGEIIREQMSQAGEYTETASDRIASANAENENALKALGDQMRETFGDKTWEELSIGLETELVKTLTDVARGIENIMTAVGLADSAFTKWLTSTTTLMGGLKLAIESALGPLGQMLAMLETFGQKSFKEIVFDTAVEGIQKTVANTVNSIKKLTNNRTTPRIPGKGGGKSGGGGKTTLSPAAQAEADMAKAEATYTNALADAEQKVIVGLMTEEDLQKTKLKLLEQIADANLNAWHLSGEDKYLTSFTNFANAAVNLRDNLMSVDDVFKQLEKDFPTLSPVGIESQSFAEGFASTAAADMGFKNEADTSSFIQDLVTKGIESGVDMSGPAATLMEKLFEGMEIPDEELQTFVDELNAKLAEMGIEPIKVNIDTKKIEKDAKVVDKSWNYAAQSIGQVASAISQLENPAAKIIGTIGQAVATIALSYAQAVKDAEEIGGPWAWIAFAATGLATMVSMISGIHSATGYAQGGIIKGNSYSGDNIGGLVDGSQLVGLNAGEVVLNHAQTETLANTLENGQQGGTTSIPYVMGEQIFLGVNAFLKRSGRGELITTKG